MSTATAREVSRATPGVSFVVIGRNEGAHLAACFRSIRESDYPKDRVEIVFVDSASDDDSVEIAKRWADEIIVAQLPGPLPGLARNLGWEAARHDLVHFVDGDTTLDPAWLGEAVRVMEDNPDAFCVFGLLTEKRPEANLYHRIYHFDWSAPASHITETRTSGGNVLIRRAALVERGGFDPALEAGEEPDLCTRARLAGERLLSVNTPMARHDMDMSTFGAYWKRAVRSGHAYAEIASRYRTSPIPLWTTEVRSNLILAGAVVALVVAVSIAWSPWLAIAIVIVGFAALVGRKFLQHAADDAPLSTKIAYALHVYVVKIPLILGHVRYYWRRTVGTRRSTEARVLDRWKRDE